MAEFCLQSCTKVRSSVNFCGSMASPPLAPPRSLLSPLRLLSGRNNRNSQPAPPSSRPCRHVPHSATAPPRPLATFPCGEGELLPLLPLYSPHAAEAPPLLPRLLTNRPYCPSFGSGVQNLLEMKVELPSGLPLSVAFGLTLFSFDSVHERMPVKVIAMHSPALVLS